MVIREGKIGGRTYQDDQGVTDQGRTDHGDQGGID